jgi:hypothetical protein
MGRSAGSPGASASGMKATSFLPFLQNVNTGNGGSTGFTLNKLGCSKQANRLEYISMG